MTDSSLQKVGAVVFVIIILFGLFIAWKMTMSSIDDYGEYKAFCKERKDFCRCSWGDCTFKTKWSSVDGFSQDTEDLCELADLLDDEKVIFEVGCE